MNAGFGRRFAALIYDSLLIVALLMIYTGIALFFTRGHAIVAQTAGGWVYLYRAGLLAVIACYYVICCHHTGHTLGMRAWRLRAQTPSGALLCLRSASVRFALGVAAWVPLALGVLWLYVDRDGLAVHDRLSKSRIVVIP